MEKPPIRKEHSSGSECNHVAGTSDNSSPVLIHRFIPAENKRTLWQEMIAWAFVSGCFFIGTTVLAVFGTRFFQEPKPTPRIILNYRGAFVLGLVFSGFGIFMLRILWKERVPLAEWFTRGPRPPMPSHPKEGKFEIYAICGVVASMLIAGLVETLTDNTTLSGRIVVSAFWLFFALMNGHNFYTGRFRWHGFRWHGGPTFTREDSPWGFYTSAIFFTLFSMSILTYGLWCVFTSSG
jgi:hypothetical protein